jgi:hypothetical protein
MLVELTIHVEETNPGHKDQPAISPKILQNPQSCEHSRGDDQTDQGQENEVENDIFWASLNRINIIRFRP